MAVRHDNEPDAVVRASLRKNAQLTIPAQVRAALYIEEGDEVEFRISGSGEVVLRGLTSVPADQRWFWTERWQAGEREASEQIASGDVTVHGEVDDFFTDLNR